MDDRRQGGIYANAETFLGISRHLGRNARNGLANQMWRNKTDKLARRDNLCFFPERRKVLAVAGDQKVGTTRIGALNKDIVVRVARHTDPAGGRNQMAVIFDETK